MFKCILLFISFIFCDQGEIISIQFMDSMTVEEVQNDLNDTFGNFAPEAQYNIHLYKIVYETIDPFGNPTNASGIISFPDNENQAFPILSFQHGTTVKRDNVSSENGFNPLSLWLTSTGYIYIEPDFLGLGVSEIMHPYCLKNPSAWSVIDMLRASSQFCIESNEIQSNDEIILAGYSEGGYVTMAAHMIMEQEIMDEFNLLVSFPMAGPYDLSGVMVDLMLDFQPYDEPFYLPYTVVSYITYYEMGDLNQYFLPEYADMFEYLFNGNYSGSYINSLLPDIPIEVMLPDVIEDFSYNMNHPLRIYLSENDLWDWAPQNDMYLFHGAGDELVPYENSLIAFNSFIDNGSENIYLYTVPEELGGHQEAAIYCLISAYQISEDNYKNIRNIGDLNNDSTLNIQDILIILSYILDEIEYNDLDLWLSDLNHSGSLNIQDIIILIGQILDI